MSYYIILYIYMCMCVCICVCMCVCVSVCVFAVILLVLFPTQFSIPLGSVNEHIYIDYGDADARSEHCFALLCRPSSAASNLPLSATMWPTFQSLVVTLVNSRLDYGNGALIGLLASLTCRLQTAVSAQRSRAADFQLASLRPCL